MSNEEDSIDQAFENLKTAITEIESLNGISQNEAETRLRIIDRLLFDVLGWTKNECKVEDRIALGFTDYTLRSQNVNKVIVEAKRDSVSFGFENRESAKAYKLNGPVFNVAANEAIHQSIIYAAFKNCELACATNGYEWIIFRALRLGEGIDTLEGKGFIFKSISDIQSNFKLFYDLLSPQSLNKLKFRGEFQIAEGTPIRDLSFLKALRIPSSKRLLPRGEFSSDFDALMSSFFERLKGDQDPEMIKFCFVVSSESQLAEEKLLRLAEDLVDKIKKLNTNTGQELIDLIESAKLQHKNRFILLVGNKGAGKSTFVNRFFEFVLPQNTSNEITLIRVDLSLNSGDETTIVDWLNQRMLEECENAIFSKSGFNWDDCVGKMFFDDYQRWSSGTMSHLYKTDKEQFKIEFGRHIEQVRSTQPHEYIKRLINYLTKSDHKIPCLIFDNTDHYTITFQEAVFQYARSIYESEFCIVILPITDKTSWQLSKEGALQSFESEVLHLPVPNPEKVLERRIEFLVNKLSDGDEKNRKEYFLNRGIRLRLDHIVSFAASLNKIFVESKEISHWIGGLSNYDIRRLLEITKDAISSPHLRLDDLLKAHLAGKSDVVPEHRIKSAIVKKRYDIYPTGEHSFVQNIYALVLDPVSSPLLGVRILQFLRDVGKYEQADEVEFVKLSELLEYFTNLGVMKSVTKAWVEILIQKGLALNYDPTVLQIDDESLIEISPSGTIHLSWATFDVDYIQMMKDVTPLRDKSVYEVILNSYSDYKNKWQNSIHAFIDYLLAEDSTYCTIPAHDSFHGQQRIQQRFRWVIERRLTTPKPLLPQ